MNMQLPNYPRPFTATADRGKKPIHLIAELKENIFEENDVDKTHLFFVNARIM